MEPEKDLCKELITAITTSFEPSQAALATRKINQLSKRPNYFESIIDMLSIRDPLTRQYMNENELKVKDCDLQINLRYTLLVQIKNQVKFANTHALNTYQKLRILSSEINQILSINWHVKTEKILKYLIELIVRQMKTSEWFEESSVLFLGVLDKIYNCGCNTQDEFALDKILTVLNGLLLGIIHVSNTRVLNLFVQILCKYLTPIMMIIDRYHREFSWETMNRVLEFGIHILFCWKKYIDQNVMGIYQHFQTLIQVKKLCYLGYYLDERREYHIQSEYFDKYYFFLISLTKNNKTQPPGLTSDTSHHLFSNKQDIKLVQHKISVFMNHYHILADSQIKYILIFIKCCSGLIYDSPSLSLLKNALLQLISVQVNKKIKDWNYDPPRYFDELDSSLFWGSLNQPFICQPTVKIAATLWRIVSEIENDSAIDFIETKNKAKKLSQMRKQYVNLNANWSKSKKQCYHNIIENVYEESKKGIICYEKSGNLNQGALQEDYSLMIDLLKSQGIQKKLMGLEIFEQIYKIDRVFIRSGQKSLFLWHYVIPNLKHQNQFIRRRSFQLLKTCIDDFLLNKSYITNLVNCVTTAILMETDLETEFIVLELVLLMMESQPWQSFINENINQILDKYKNYFRLSYQEEAKAVNLMDCFYDFLDKKRNALLTNSSIPSLFETLIEIQMLNNSEVAGSEPMNKVLVFMTELCENPEMEAEMRPLLMKIYEHFLAIFINNSRQNQDRPDKETDEKLQKTQQILSSYLASVNKECFEHIRIYICAYSCLSHFNIPHQQFLDHLVQPFKTQIESERQHLRITHTKPNISLYIPFVELMGSMIIEEGRSEKQNSLISKQQVAKILNRQESRQYRYNQLFSNLFQGDSSIRYQSLFFKAITNFYIHLEKLLLDQFQPKEIQRIVTSNFSQYIAPGPHQMLLLTLQLKKKRSAGIKKLNVLTLEVIEHYCFQFKGIIFMSVLQDIWKAITSIFNLILLDGRSISQNMIRLQNIIGVLICQSPNQIINLANLNKQALTITQVMQLMMVKTEIYHSEGIDGNSLSQKINILNEIDAFSKIKVEALCRMISGDSIVTSIQMGKYCNEMIQTIDFYYMENIENRSQLCLLTLNFDTFEQEIDVDLDLLSDDAFDQSPDLRQYGYPYSITSINIKDIIQETLAILSNKKTNKEPVCSKVTQYFTNKLIQLFIS